MGWRQRLLEIALAGGLAAGAAGCPSGFNPPACNASPDPCCSDPHGAACQSRDACEVHPTATCCAESNNRFIVHGCLPDGGVDGGP